MIKQTMRILCAAMAVAAAGGMARQAEAGTSFGLTVESQAVPEAGEWRYSYTIDYSVGAVGLVSGSPVVGLTLPFFDSGIISDIHSPAGWGSAFTSATASNWPYTAAGDPGVYTVPASSFEGTPYVLSWSIVSVPAFKGAKAQGISVGGVFPGQSLSGFDYLSPYGPGEGPVVLFLGINAASSALADPVLPASPSSPFVPEPASVGLLVLGGMGLLWRRRA